MIDNDYDITVIGGGPAGSSVSYLLSKAGLKVCLIEKKEFPREVLCGEFLSLEVVKYLKSISLFDKFLSLKPEQINNLNLYSEEYFVSTKLGFSGFALRRSLFDQLLLNESINAGTRVIQPGEVSEINDTNEGKEIKFRHSGNLSSIKTRLIIAAYGKQNILDKKLRRPFYNFKSGLNGLKYHLPESMIKNFDLNSISIFTSEGIYCGINKVDNGFYTLCYLEKRTHSNINNNLKTLFNNNRYLRDVIPDHDIILQNLQVYGTGNIFFGKRNLFNNGIFMCGDSAGVISPLAGDGIGMAIESAQILASVLIKFFSKSITISDSEKEYETAWNNAFKKRLRTASYIQAFLLNSTFQNTAFYALKHIPQILPFLIKQTRNF